MLSFFPQGVLDEILNLIESVSEDFPSYYSNVSASYFVISVCIDNGKLVTTMTRGTTNFSIVSKVAHQ